MPNNMRIVPLNFHDTATLTATPTAEDNFPPENTQNTSRDSRFRSQDLSDQVLKGTWNGDGRYVNTFAFFLHNAHAGTVQLELFSDDAWTTSVYDSGPLDAGIFASLGDFSWGYDPLGGSLTDPLGFEAPYIMYFDTVQIQSYRITWSGFASGLGCLEVGRVWLGKYFESTINPAYGVQLGVGDNTTRSRTHGGTSRSSPGARWRTFAIDMNYMDEADRSIWLDIMEVLQTNGDFILSVFPGAGGRQERDYTMNAKFTSLDPLVYQVSYRTKKIVGEEV